MLYTERTRRYTDRRSSGALRPPFYSDITFYSKERIDGFVKNKLDATGDSDGKIGGRKHIHLDGSTYLLLQNPVEIVSLTDTIITEIVIKNKTVGNSYYGGTAISLVNWFGIVADIWYLRDDSKNLVLFGSMSGIGTDFILRITSTPNITSAMVTVEFIEESQTTTFTKTLVNGLSINRYLARVSETITECDIYSIKNIKNNEIISDYILNEGVGGICYDRSGNGNHATITGTAVGVRATDLTQIPINISSGCSIISGIDGEVPAKLGLQVDALNGDPLTNPAISKIVSNVDGYIILPDDIKITVDIDGTPTEVGIFDRSNPYLYTDDARNVLDYLGVGYEYYWRIDKLNTANILSWMQPDYKFSWFVKNTFTEGTSDPITIKEIIAYNAPITGADNLSKMMKYLNLPEVV